MGWTVAGIFKVSWEERKDSEVVFIYKRFIAIDYYRQDFVLSNKANECRVNQNNEPRLGGKIGGVSEVLRNTEEKDAEWMEF